MGFVKACPRCAAVAAGPSIKCRECGALLVASPLPLPAPPSPFAPGPATGPPTPGPSVAERFFAPATFTPVVAPPRERGAEKRDRAKRSEKRGVPIPVVPILVAVVLVACAAAAYATFRSGAASGGASKTPVVLPPVDESRGLPSLGDTVRIQAESARQRAFAVVGQAAGTSGGAPLDAQTLRNLDPSLKWVTGEQSSTEPGMVSFSQSASGVTIAVSTRSREVCALGRWSPGAPNTFVTLGDVSACRAADAPVTGWAERSPTDGGSRYAPPDGY
jgi:hypothetical protein